MFYRPQLFCLKDENTLLSELLYGDGEWIFYISISNIFKI